MNGVTHEEITRAVVRAVQGSETTATVAAEFAAFPDAVDDVVVDGVGPTIVGRHLCSLTHFQVPTTLRLFRGYCWSSDKSIQPRIGRLALPHRRVECDTSRWWNVLGSCAAADRHPLALLLSSLVGKATIAADQMTYPTAAVMADWIGKAKPKNEAQLGCVLHYVQDCAVVHHSSGWMLNGHAYYEGALQEDWHTTGSANIDRWLNSAARSRRQLEPRAACEELTRLTRRATVSTPLVLSRAVAYTAAVVRWWMGRRKP